MEFDGISGRERDDLLKRHQGYVRQRGASTDGAERRRFKALADSLRGEYADRISRVALSRCPFCEQPLVRAFDPHGLDGFWWHAVSPARFMEPAPCEHFAVLQGALNLHGRSPREARIAVEPGPEIPFVIPRLLGLEGMKAVCFSFKMKTGDTAYPIAYFAPRVPPAKELHQPWRKRGYQVVDDDGVPGGWATKLDLWDFDLAPWIQQDRLLWIEPEDPDLKLHGSADGKSPFSGLTGEQRPQRCQRGQRLLLPLPTGGTAAPFD